MLFILARARGFQFVVKFAGLLPFQKSQCNLFCPLRIADVPAHRRASQNSYNNTNIHTNTPPIDEHDALAPTRVCTPYGRVRCFYVWVRTTRICFLGLEEFVRISAAESAACFFPTPEHTHARIDTTAGTVKGKLHSNPHF